MPQPAAAEPQPAAAEPQPAAARAHGRRVLSLGERRPLCDTFNYTDDFTINGVNQGGLLCTDLKLGTAANAGYLAADNENIGIEGQTEGNRLAMADRGEISCAECKYYRQSDRSICGCDSGTATAHPFDDTSAAYHTYHYDFYEAKLDDDGATVELAPRLDGQTTCVATRARARPRRPRRRRRRRLSPPPPTPPPHAPINCPGEAALIGRTGVPASVTDCDDLHLGTASGDAFVAEIANAVAAVCTARRASTSATRCARATTPPSPTAPRSCASRGAIWPTAPGQPRCDDAGSEVAIQLCPPAAPPPPPRVPLHGTCTRPDDPLTQQINERDFPLILPDGRPTWDGCDVICSDCIID